MASESPHLTSKLTPTRGNTVFGIHENWWMTAGSLFSLKTREIRHRCKEQNGHERICKIVKFSEGLESFGAYRLLWERLVAA